MWESIPSIIEEAAKNALGITALIILALSLVAYYFFKGSDTKHKIGIFVLMFVGFGMFLTAAYLAELEETPSKPINANGEYLLEAALLTEQANHFQSVGEDGSARIAYDKAIELYKAKDDLQGEADVLSELGDLERRLDRMKEARQAYREALTIYKAIGDKRSEVDIQLALNSLEYFSRIKSQSPTASPNEYPRNTVELIPYVANKNELTTEEAEKIVDVLFDGISKTLANNGDVRLPGFGTFSVAHRNGSQGRNPRTGEKIYIPAYNMPKFKAGKTLKDAVQ